jgi:hypothetical protein
MGLFIVILSLKILLCLVEFVNCVILVGLLFVKIGGKLIVGLLIMLHLRFWKERNTIYQLIYGA